MLKKFKIYLILVILAIYFILEVIKSSSTLPCTTECIYQGCGNGPSYCYPCLGWDFVCKIPFHCAVWSNCPDKAISLYCYSNCFPSTISCECSTECGASPECNYVKPGTTLQDICDIKTLIINRQCTSQCEYKETKLSCDLSLCGVSQTCGGSDYFCVYDNGWKWSTSKPSNFCCTDSDCPSGLKCNLNTYRCEEICTKDEDCSYMNCGLYAAYCDLSTKKCKCYSQCSNTKYNCADKACCKYEITGKPEDQICVPMGTVINWQGKSYLCDPIEHSNNKYIQNIFNFILKFFKILFN